MDAQHPPFSGNTVFAVSILLRCGDWKERRINCEIFLIQRQNTTMAHTDIGF